MQTIAATIAEAAADLRARATGYRARVREALLCDAPAGLVLLKANEWEKFAEELEKVAASLEGKA